MKYDFKRKYFHSGDVIALSVQKATATTWMGAYEWRTKVVDINAGFMAFRLNFEQHHWWTGKREKGYIQFACTFSSSLYRNDPAMEVTFDFVGEAPFDQTTVDGMVALVMSQMDKILEPINIAVWGQE